jgi:hypothetical protein
VKQRGYADMNKQSFREQAMKGMETEITTSVAAKPPSPLESQQHQIKRLLDEKMEEFDQAITML